jgi:hypothetical protein
MTSRGRIVPHRIAPSTRQREIRIARTSPLYGVGDSNGRMSRIVVDFFELSVFTKS